MIQMYYNQFAASVQGSDIYCTTARCKYNWFRSVLFQSYFPSVYTGIQLQSVTRNFLDKTEQALHSFVFPLTLLCFLKWHFFFKLSADTGSWKLRFTSATFPQRCPPTVVSSPAIEVYPFFNIRTSNFGADAEPKVNVLIFCHVLTLRSTERQKTNMNVTMKHEKEHCTLYHVKFLYHNVTSTQRGNFIKKFKKLFLAFADRSFTFSTGI